MTEANAWLSAGSYKTSTLAGGSLLPTVGGPHGTKPRTLGLTQVEATLQMDSHVPWHPQVPRGGGSTSAC